MPKPKTRSAKKTAPVINRIAIASDPLMTKETEQFSNRRWMKDILTRPIEMATGLKPVSLASSRSDPNLINRTEFFNLSDIDLDLDQTQFWFDDAGISQASLNYLGKFVDRQTLVIGYEMSRQTRAVLEHLGTPYVDIWLHPVRFLDDIMFSMNSNIPALRDRLFTYDVPEAEMYLYADRIRVQTYKGWRRIEAQVRPNSALFVGQMMNDKSVCHEGQMLTLLDFKKRFEEIAATHDHVYYSRHPYMRSGDEDVLSFVRSHPKTDMALAPSYRLLSSQRIKTVFSLSSSVVQEARYFEKATEHLFQPIVEFGDPSKPTHGASILQDLVSPHFWADVLSPLIKTKPCPEVMFRDSKDKLRDMLGFYWSYSDIDKVEHIRKPASTPPPASAKPNRPARKAKRQFLHPSGFTQTSAQIAELQNAIAAHKVISFDVFDTLIERVVDQPNDLFDLMASRACEITGRPGLDFPTQRRKARDLALDRANGEEVLLSDRYAALAAHLGLSEDVGRELYQLELDFEAQICRPRWAGKIAFDAALAGGKTILLISDIFFDRAFVEKLLGQAGYKNWDRLYLSSEAGVLKQTGRLFDHVISAENLKPNDVLHIGDNMKADIEMGTSRGVSTFHLPDKARIAAKLSKLPDAFDGISEPISKSLIKGLTSREASKGIVPQAPGLSHKSAETLGYRVLGPAFWGFAKWIAAEARSTEISDIYFLARDGDIAKRCYDIVTANDPDAPRSHYVLASRRALNVAGLETAGDIARLLATNFTPCDIGALIRNRFGLDPGTIPQTAWGSFGFVGPDSLADWKTNRSGVERFFALPEVVAAILQNAADERKALKDAYAIQGVASSLNPAFVDIGHSGSLQAAISRLFSLPKTTGLYFCTKSDIDAALPGAHHIAEGYVADRMSHADARHPYQRHILMYELMFQNDKGSFLRYGPTGAEFLDTSNEAERISFIRPAHEGICRFVRDLTDVEQALSLKLNVTGSEACRGMQLLFTDPWPGDVALFEGIGFENRYSSRDIRWIIPSSGAEDKTPPLWKEGAALQRAQLEAKGTPLSLGSKILKSGAFLVRDTRKREKLLRDPSGFVMDSQKPAMRLLKRLT